MRQLLIFLSLTFFTVVFLAGSIPTSVFAAGDHTARFTRLVEQDKGLSKDEKRAWIASVSRTFQNTNFTFDYSRLIYGILSQAKFDDVSMDRALTVALQSASAVERGASEKQVTELALFAFSVDFTRDELYLYAMVAKTCDTYRIPVHVTQEMIRHAKENDWPHSTFTTIMNGLVKAAQNDLDPEKLALYMLISVDQKLGTPDEIVRDAIEDATKRKSPVVKERHQEELIPTRPALRRRSPRVALDYDAFRHSVESFIGTPYVWGGNTRNGVDCSGFTRLVMHENGYVLPRVSRDQAKAGISIKKSNLQLGDLVFFDTRGWGYVTHVGFYLGGNLLVHASSSKGVTIVMFSNRYFQSRYVSARRIIRYVDR